MDMVASRSREFVLANANTSSAAEPCGGTGTVECTLNRQGLPEDAPALVDTIEGTLNIDAETALVEGERFLCLCGAAALVRSQTPWFCFVCSICEDVVARG